MLKDVVAFVPAVLCQFLRPMQLYRTIKSQVWHGVSCNFSTVAQLIFWLEQRSILCNFVAKMWWTIGQFLFMRQSCSMRHGMSHFRFCRTIKLRDKITR